VKHRNYSSFRASADGKNISLQYVLAAISDEVTSLGQRLAFPEIQFGESFTID
jgi:hypothetical protein